MIGVLRNAAREDGSNLAGKRLADSALTPPHRHSRIDPLLIPTRESLLSRLKQTSADESWREFFETYWRLIYHNARKAGLADEDAQEVVQETMVALTKNIAEFRYNPTRCSFKTWLLNLTRWKILDRLRLNERVRKDQQNFRAQIQERIDKAWEEDWRLNVTEEALRRVQEQARPRLVQAFATHIIQGRSAAETSALLRMSVPAVYLACYRIRRLIKKEALKIEEGKV
jgi:RNA polymerase sigma factor (sigma-70 family)